MHASVLICIVLHIPCKRYNKSEKTLVWLVLWDASDMVAPLASLVASVKPQRTKHDARTSLVSAVIIKSTRDDQERENNMIRHNHSNTDLISSRDLNASYGYSARGRGVLFVLLPAYAAVSVCNWEPVHWYLMNCTGWIVCPLFRGWTTHGPRSLGLHSVPLFCNLHRLRFGWATLHTVNWARPLDNNGQ